MSEFFEIEPNEYALMISAFDFGANQSHDALFVRPTIQFISFKSLELAEGARKSLENAKLNGVAVTALYRTP